MVKKIISFLVAILLVFVTSTQVFAVTSNLPLPMLTKQEKEYFSELKSLRVLTAPNLQPYVYNNVGVSLDILARLCEVAGVKLEVIEAKSYEDALIRLDNGEAELAAIKILPQDNTDKMLPYLVAPIQAVHYRQANLSEQSSFSVAQLQELNFLYDKEQSTVGSTEYLTKSMDKYSMAFKKCFYC